MKLTENQLRKIVRAMLIEAGGFVGAFRAGRGGRDRRNKPKTGGYAPVRTSGSFSDYDNEGDMDEVDDISVELEEDETYED